jgi:hypothetical protein
MTGCDSVASLTCMAMALALIQSVTEGLICVEEHQKFVSHTNPICFTRNYGRVWPGSPQVYVSTLHANFPV